MYVVEPSACGLEAMKITVVNANGVEWVVDVLPEFTIDKLKLMALSHFYNPVDSIKTADQFKLILVSEGRPLPDEGTVRDENIREDDQLLLLRRRAIPSPNNETIKEREDKAYGPTEAEIQKYTADLASKNMENIAEENQVVVDFFTELKKILVSLLNVSEKLLRHHPDMIELLQDMSEEVPKPAPQQPDNIDQSAVKQLMDMGFPKEQVLQALKLHSNSEEATEWLLAKGVDSDISSPSASNVQSTYNSSVPSTERVTDQQENASTSDSTNILPNVSQLPTESDQNPIVKMLQCFRSYKRKVFRPNMKAFNNLKEMGFPETDILDALRINGNNQDSACEWLLNDKKMTYEDLKNGLDPDGPIYKAIMANPVVQLGLSNPNTFLALLHMLENPNNACRWLNDPDTGPILGQIFRIYHAEKHSLQLTRPFPQ